MIENQPQVINNPVYLSALAASLSSSEEHEGQGVLEEENVRDLDTVARGRVSRDCGRYIFQMNERLRLALSLIKKELELLRLQQKISKEVRQNLACRLLL